MTNCCNPKHPQDKPELAEFVLTDRNNQPHFLCDLCATILDSLGNLDTFIEEIGEWERQNLSVAEWQRRDAEAYGDMLYDLSIGT
ncbi:MAG: hypothetical protein DPW09_31965 [Anaerolineae bacterium]|nr:hypothetical protein [Anaerolineales bacterium]MCQ3978066.1 hypothetical protein [Anaerolineae bacterium]